MNCANRLRMTRKGGLECREGGHVPSEAFINCHYWRQDFAFYVFLGIEGDKSRMTAIPWRKNLPKARVHVVSFKYNFIFLHP